MARHIGVLSIRQSPSTAPTVVDALAADGLRMTMTPSVFLWMNEEIARLTSPCAVASFPSLGNDKLRGKAAGIRFKGVQRNRA